MWINFYATQPFAIKVFAGGINVVSGEGAFKDMATFFRLKEKLSQDKSIQDYVVAPNQKWLDGVAKLDGQVMQFVATSEGSGYSVEAQVTGHDSVGGLQFEVIPAKYVEPKKLTIIIRHMNEDDTYFTVEHNAELGGIFQAYRSSHGQALDQCVFIYDGARVSSG